MGGRPGKVRKARIKELKYEVRKAIETKNAKQVRLLHLELTALDWMILPPIEYRQKLTSAVLWGYAELLMEQYSASDYDSAMGIYDKMQEFLFSEQMTMPPAISQLIHPAIQWNMYNNAIVTLQDALNEEAPAPELEHFHYDLKTAALQAGRTVPAALEESYRSEVSRQYTSASRRHLLAVMVIGGICLLVGGPLFLTLWFEYKKSPNGSRTKKNDIGEIEKVNLENTRKKLSNAIAATSKPNWDKYKEFLATLTYDKDAKEVLRNWDSFQRGLQNNEFLKPVGFLIINDKGKWDCIMNPNTTPTARSRGLYIFHQKGKDDARKAILSGKLTDNEAILDKNSEKSFLQYAPVFLGI